MDWTLSVDDLLEELGTERSQGYFEGTLTGIAELGKAHAGQLSFLSDHRYARYLGESEASVVLVPADKTGEPRAGQMWIHVKDPSIALATVCSRLEKRLLPTAPAGIHPTAFVDETAQVPASASIGAQAVIEAGVNLGEGVVIGAGTVVEKGARVGDHSVLLSRVTVGWNCLVGSHCLLHSGVVVGSDGFGYHSDASGHRKLPQIGMAVIEDHVEIGANSTVDRARFAETRIGEGTKIDNLVQIGHNVILGKHCILCAQSGVAGSAELGDFVVLGGQVGVIGHIQVGDGTKITGQSGVSKNTGSGMVLSGSPARDHREEMKRHAHVSRIPALQERLRRLEEKLEHLK
ncbi:MAG: UDP-3-O-(3-hydroxymyristoyl)glucosamine N-acyltransferase [Verrucomicrobia bacterium]|jgi:UDP-3-O-[3-hydroxymyristoyl] glucosamine N-acyltransferase|nr:UDP-3-O-(3-hydroxymyristoyl)glucosamine N-acyltransferase [Verrucomicrobiota bacterium]